MKQLPHIALAAAVTATAALLPGPAQALVKWTFQAGNCAGVCDTGSRTFGADDAQTGDVTATAWANTEPGATNNQLAAGALQQFTGGLGVINADTGAENDSDPPEHGMDNKDRFDAILLDFGSESVSISEIAVGYRVNDGDISVLAWLGGGAPTLTGALYSATQEDLTASGWSLIGNYDVNTDVGNGVFTQNVSTPVSSSYWLIGAYNPVFGACAGTDVCSYGYDQYGADKHDYVKLLSVAGYADKPPPPPPQVSAPLSLALLGGLLPLARRRRG